MSKKSHAEAQKSSSSLHRPRPQRPVVGEVETALGAEPPHVPGQLRLLHALGRRLPQHLAGLPLDGCSHDCTPTSHVRPGRRPSPGADTTDGWPRPAAGRHHRFRTDRSG